MQEVRDPEAAVKACGRRARPLPPRGPLAPPGPLVLRPGLRPAAAAKGRSSICCGSPGPQVLPQLRQGPGEALLLQPVHVRAVLLKVPTALPLVSTATRLTTSTRLLQILDIMLLLLLLLFAERKLVCLSPRGGSSKPNRDCQRTHWSIHSKECLETSSAAVQTRPGIEPLLRFVFAPNFLGSQPGYFWSANGPSNRPGYNLDMALLKHKNLSEDVVLKQVLKQQIKLKKAVAAAASNRDSLPSAPSPSSSSKQQQQKQQQQQQATPKTPAAAAAVPTPSAASGSKAAPPSSDHATLIAKATATLTKALTGLVRAISPSRSPAPALASTQAPNPTLATAQAPAPTPSSAPSGTVPSPATVAPASTEDDTIVIDLTDEVPQPARAPHHHRRVSQAALALATDVVDLTCDSDDD